MIEQYNVEKIIMGYPKNMDGTIGFRGEKTIEFIDILKKETDVQIIKWDERLTTVAANRVMREVGMKGTRKKMVIDQIAAMYILQGYLDSTNR